MLDKPYKVIFAFIPIVLLVTIPNFEETIDIQMHDTYFVLLKGHVGLLLIVLLLILAFMYFITRKLMVVKWILYLHVIANLLLIFGVLITIYMYSYSRGLVGLDNYDPKVNKLKMQFIFGGVVLFIGVQLLYFSNLFYKIVKRLIKK